MKKYLSIKHESKESIDLRDELWLWSAPFGLKLLEYIDYKPNITAIDIGFGTGFPLTEIAMRLGDSSKVYGIDPWEEAIERANRKIKDYGIENVKIFKGTAESIPLESNSIDLITSNNGINNSKDIDTVISECSRIIKKGGQLIQTMNLDKSMFEFYYQFEKTLSEYNLRKEIDMMHQDIEKKRPPIDSIISILHKYGFLIKDMVNDQFEYKFTNGTAMLNHKFINSAFMESWTKILPKDKIETIFDSVENKLNKQAEVLGCIKLSIPFVMINAIKQ